MRNSYAEVSFNNNNNDNNSSNNGFITCRSDNKDIGINRQTRKMFLHYTNILN